MCRFHTDYRSCIIRLYPLLALVEPVAMVFLLCLFFFFSSRRRHTRLQGDWSSDVCSSDLTRVAPRELCGPLVARARAEAIREHGAQLVPLRAIVAVRQRARIESESVEQLEIGRASCRERV